MNATWRAQHRAVNFLFSILAENKQKEKSIFEEFYGYEEIII
jgi:hypothetical protein